MTPIFRLALLAPLFLAAVAAAGGQTAREAPTTRVAIAFSGGHETDPKDRGRPVVLIAAALGVPPGVFREAFSHVRPAPAGTEPDPRQVRDNKTALLTALGRYGVTNERLDTVSNYYRYVRSRNELWPAKPATGYAIVKEGKIDQYVITNGGSGYSSPPAVTVPGAAGPPVTAQLAFRRDFEKNGSVAAIVVVLLKKSSNTVAGTRLGSSGLVEISLNKGPRLGVSRLHSQSECFDSDREV